MIKIRGKLINERHIAYVETEVYAEIPHFWKENIVLRIYFVGTSNFLSFSFFEEEAEELKKTLETLEKVL